MRALGQLLGPGSGSEELRDTGEGRDAGLAPRSRGRSAQAWIPVPGARALPGAHSAVPAPPPGRAAPHLSTRPAGTSTEADSGSGSMGLRSAAARARAPRPRPAHRRKSARP